MKEIFENYESFYNMVLSTTIMSNSKCYELDRDMKSIIEFIGSAFGFDKNLIDKCSEIIIDRLSTMGLVTDQQAIYSSRRFEDTHTDLDILFDIKGDVLDKLQNLLKSNPDINDGWFDYTHYKTYQPNVRYSKINIASACGNVIATRQVGILRALGIGCNVDYQLSVNRLTQCAYWGDIPSIYYLAYVYRLKGEESKSKLFGEVAELAQKHLITGITIVPPDDRTKYSNEACSIYALISTIKQDVVKAYNIPEIDFSFLEAILLDSLDYNKRMYYINSYKTNEWKNLTNSCNLSNKVGF